MQFHPHQIKILHQVWVQGEAEMPDEYRKNRALWRAALPSEWKMKLWDEEAAEAQWPDDWHKISPRCAHPATKADIILARAQRDFGGMATGTDVVPHNIPDLLRWCELNGTLVVYNPVEKIASNGLSYVERAGHEFWKAVCAHQLRDNLSHLANHQVWMATGPRAWGEVVQQRVWDIAMATELRAFGSYAKTAGSILGHLYVPSRAFVNPGYANTWRLKK